MPYVVRHILPNMVHYRGTSHQGRTSTEVMSFQRVSNPGSYQEVKHPNEYHRAPGGRDATDATSIRMDIVGPQSDPSVI